ncbi:hypothetical protein MHEL_48260 [Mycolicibacterium helvum]|uniref:Uncharacterized protein n=1 Tax=Mycolicibacterium helvum TaxID=1534349 RepID=A0A7I7TCV8_9MYCO|nr:hypothetical protein MHEL_48260 [Mycolicibacterium helvum]
MSDTHSAVCPNNCVASNTPADLLPLWQLISVPSGNRLNESDAVVRKTAIPRRHLPEWYGAVIAYPRGGQSKVQL